MTVAVRMEWVKIDALGKITMYIISNKIKVLYFKTVYYVI